jgi:hypothetical protein
VAKISRPIVYVAVIGAIAYAAVLLTEPDKPPVKVVRRTAPAVQAPKGFAEEDLNAVFPRYAARARDAFLPKVMSSKRSVATAPADGKSAETASGLPAGVWMLTGITSVNGVRTALVENGSAGDSVFLKVGDIWNGMRVAAIEQNSLVMVSPAGRKTRFGFPAFDEAPAVTTAPVPGIPGLASGPASVAPVILPPPPGFRGRRGAAPPVSVPIQVESRTPSESPRSPITDNKTKSAPEMLSSVSGASLAADTGRRAASE